MEGLIPIKNFAEVEKGKLYRSAQPMYDYEFAWLAKQGILTLVNLREESNHDEEHAPKHGLHVIKYNIKDHHSPRLQQAHLFMTLVKQSKTPMLFHCEHGQGRTSTFCVLARLAKGWSLDKALKEEKDRFGYEFKHPEQLKFLNQFR